jgi:glycerol kinase
MFRSEVIERYCNAGQFEQIPVAGIAGDQQAALFGRLPNRGWKKYLWNGCFMMMNIGNKPIESSNFLIGKAE